MKASTNMNELGRADLLYDERTGRVFHWDGQILWALMQVRPDYLEGQPEIYGRPQYWYWNGDGGIDVWPKLLS